MKNYYVYFTILLYFNVYCQKTILNIDLYDGSAYLTSMNQSNDLVLNTSRLIFQEIDFNILSKKQKAVFTSTSMIFTALLGQPMTHEEGHRSVLTELGIGSINKPFVDKYGVAKVTGVSNATLLSLRNTDLKNYIRLHTAGLESDFAYLKKQDALFNFNEEEHDLIWGDYITRKLGIQLYFLSALFKQKVNINELDKVEIDRDIVGHDIYGMVRHLHRPNMEFYRYTTYDDLLSEEKKFAQRIAYTSLLNFINPAIWQQKNFNLSKNIKANFSVNYSLTPFGDFVEQNFYLNINNKYKLNPYFRQYFNKSYAFFAGGFNLQNLPIKDDKFLLNASLDYWNQPRNLNFKTKESDLGFGIKSSLGIRFSSWNEKKKQIYFNIGMAYKTAGFIPERPSLNQDFRINMGLILSTN